MSAVMPLRAARVERIGAEVDERISCIKAAIASQLGRCAGVEAHIARAQSQAASPVEPQSEGAPGDSQEPNSQEARSVEDPKVSEGSSSDSEKQVEVSVEPSAGALSSASSDSSSTDEVPTASHARARQWAQDSPVGVGSMREALKAAFRDQSSFRRCPRRGV